MDTWSHFGRISPTHPVDIQPHLPEVWYFGRLKGCRKKHQTSGGLDLKGWLICFLAAFGSILSSTKTVETARSFQVYRTRRPKMFPNLLLGKVCVSKSVGPKVLKMVSCQRDYHENTFTPSRFISKFSN